MRQAVYGTARIGLHRSISDKLVEMNEGKPVNFIMKTLSGMASGAIAVCFGTPFDVALVRMQADSMKPAAEQKHYKNVFDALVRIVREEGALKLYSGLAPNILRGMSMNVGMLACYDQAKELVSSALSVPATSMNAQLGASVIAGFTAAAFSLPFDMVKSRLQDKNRYKGVADTFTQIYRKVRNSDAYIHTYIIYYDHLFTLL
jgi:solute carrier family 25 oxoglutarate transporter 11